MFNTLTDRAITPKKYDKLNRVAEKAAKKYDDYPDTLFTLVSEHNNKKTLKSVVDTWKSKSNFVTKGARVYPIGPGGEVQDLSKDEEDEGAE